MRKKSYFISDIHLGFPNAEKSRKREKLLVKLLDEIKENAEAIYFLGDIFDFWWEYKFVVPRGFTRFFGKVAELTDRKIPVYFFAGNHDIWMKDYLEKEVGVFVKHGIFETKINDKKFLITHGDGLGPGDKKYKLLKKMFENSFLQWCFSRLHPNFAFTIAEKWSHSRRKKPCYNKFRGKKIEYLYLYAEEKLKTEYFDFFVFGHRHIPLIINMNENTKYINIGDWMFKFTYGIFDGNKFELKTYKNGKQESFIADLKKKYFTDYSQI